MVPTTLSPYMHERYKQLFGAELDTFLSTIDRPLDTTLRVNTLKTDHDALAARLRKKGVSLESIDSVGMRVIDAPFSMASTPEHLFGLFYLQGAAEMAVAPQLACARHESVWDMCAAPGGKTTHISQLMENTGVVVATDVSSSKLQALKNNVARMGCHDTIIFQSDARTFTPSMKFDRVLLDAPCTGSGIMRRDPTRKTSRGPEDIAFMHALQKGLLEKAIASVEPGGIIIYATCSLEPEENEKVIDWALRTQPVTTLPLLPSHAVISPAFEAPFGKKLNEGVARCGRIHPHTNDSNGMFIARLALTDR